MKKNINDLISDNVSLISKICVRLMVRQDDKLLKDITEYLFEVFKYLVDERNVCNEQSNNKNKKNQKET